MSKLSTKQRARLPKTDFAYVDKKGEEHLPIHDEEHVRNALARWNQTHFESTAAKESARKKILRAAKKFAIEISEDDKVVNSR
jgi:hypothetical protein